MTIRVDDRNGHWLYRAPASTVVSLAVAPDAAPPVNVSIADEGLFTGETRPCGPTVSLPGASPVTVAQAVTFTAVVSVASGTGTPTGTVTFNDGGIVLGQGTLSAGRATFTTNALTPGTHVIGAQYGRDSSFSGSTNFVTQLVII